MTLLTRKQNNGLDYFIYPNLSAVLVPIKTAALLVGKSEKSVEVWVKYKDAKVLEIDGQVLLDLFYLTACLEFFSPELLSTSDYISQKLGISAEVNLTVKQPNKRLSVLDFAQEQVELVAWQARVDRIKLRTADYRLKLAPKKATSIIEGTKRAIAYLSYLEPGTCELEVSRLINKAYSEAQVTCEGLSSTVTR